MAITGYPNFSRLPDRETTEHLKLIWDALIGLSNDIAAVQAALPNTSPLQAQVNNLANRLSVLESSVMTLI